MAALYRGFQRAAADGRIGGVEAVMVDAFTVEAGAAARRVLEGPGRPTALAAAADVLAIGALLAARELGLRVPEDLAVVGYGDIEIARLLDPPLATLSTPTLEMGRLAAESPRSTDARRLPPCRDHHPADALHRPPELRLHRCRAMRSPFAAGRAAASTHLKWRKMGGNGPYYRLS